MVLRSLWDQEDHRCCCQYETVTNATTEVEPIAIWHRQREQHQGRKPVFRLLNHIRCRKSTYRVAGLLETLLRQFTNANFIFHHENELLHTRAPSNFPAPTSRTESPEA